MIGNKSGAAVLAVVLIGFTLPMYPCPAVAAPEARIWLYGTMAQGSGWEAFANQTAECIVSDSRGAFKGESRTGISVAGHWTVYFQAPGCWILPGDTVQLKVGGVDQGSVKIPSLKIGRISAARDLVGGRVSLAGADMPGTKELLLGDLYFSPAGREEKETVITLATDAGGRFQVDTTGQHDIVQATDVVLGYRSGVFAVLRDVQAPGFEVDIGDNYCYAYAIKLGAYTGSLYGPSGRLKAVIRINNGPGDLAIGGFFNGRRGPKPVLPGDRIVIEGPSSMSTKVPPFEISVDSAAETVSGKTLPGTTLEVRLRRMADNGTGTYHFAYPTTDTLGNFSVSFAPSDVKFGDYVQVMLRNSRGSYFVGRIQVPTP